MKKGMQYKNPILPGFYPDPSICFDKGWYYLVTSSFQWFPGIPIFRSQNLIDWQQIGFCLTTQTQLDLTNRPSSMGIFAPTIRYWNNTFYVITTDFNGAGNILIKAQDPAGPWSDPIKINLPGIDPSLYFDKQQVLVQTTGEGQGIIQAPINIETGECGPAKMIWSGTGGRFPEAPHLYKVNESYYLMLAEGGTEYGHMVTIARSDSPWGPFECCPDNPILTHRNTEWHPIQGVGHGDLIEDQAGKWWLVCLGFRPKHGYYHHLGRETFLAPVTWSEDGWPVVNNNQPLSMDTNHETSTTIWQDDFDEPRLKQEWQFLRNPAKDSWSLTNEPGWLQLIGQPGSLHDLLPKAMIARRQQHFNIEFSSKCCFVPQASTDEAGITIMMDEHHHVDCFCTMVDDRKKICLRSQIGTINTILNSIHWSSDEFIITIKADSEFYVFEANSDQGQPIGLGQVMTKYLSSEVAGGYTGVMLGLYATGNGQVSKTGAVFDWVRYQKL